MNSTRLWTVGSVMVILALLAGTWFIGISPKLAEAAIANSDRSTVENQNRMHAATLASLSEKAEKLDELKAELAALRTAVPSQPNLSNLLGQINAMAAATGVSVSQLTAGDAVGYLPVAEQEGLDPELVSSLSSVGEDSYFVIPIGMNLVGEYGDVMAFVNRVQNGDRLLLVHDLSLTKGPAVSGQSVEYSLTGQTFVFLDSATVTASETDAPTEVAAG